MRLEIVLWWLARWSDGIAITTSSSWVQVRTEIWGEIHKAIRGALIEYPMPNQTEIKLGPDCYALGLSTNEDTNIQGFHGNHVLVVLDEAPGIPAEILGGRGGGALWGSTRVIALGNPTIASGPFYDMFTKHRALWKTFTIDAFDTLNLQGTTPLEFAIQADSIC